MNTSIYAHDKDVQPLFLKHTRDLWCHKYLEKVILSGVY